MAESVSCVPGTCVRSRSLPSRCPDERHCATSISVSSLVSLFSPLGLHSSVCSFVIVRSQGLHHRWLNRSSGRFVLAQSHHLSFATPEACSLNCGRILNQAFCHSRTCRSHSCMCFSFGFGQLSSGAHRHYQRGFHCWHDLPQRTLLLPHRRWRFLRHSSTGYNACYSIFGVPAGLGFPDVLCQLLKIHLLPFCFLVFFLFHQTDHLFRFLIVRFPFFHQSICDLFDQIWRTSSIEPTRFEPPHPHAPRCRKNVHHVQGALQ